jgi:hypothetical protein
MLKWSHFIDNCSLPSSSTMVSTVEESGAASIRGACPTADIPRHHNARRPLQSSSNNHKNACILGL